MKKISLTMAAMMALILTTFAQHGNCNNYSQQAYVV